MGVVGRSLYGWQEFNCKLSQWLISGCISFLNRLLGWFDGFPWTARCMRSADPLSTRLTERRPCARSRRAMRKIRLNMQRDRFAEKTSTRWTRSLARHVSTLLLGEVCDKVSLCLKCMRVCACALGVGETVENTRESVFSRLDFTCVGGVSVGANAGRISRSRNGRRYGSLCLCIGPQWIRHIQRGTEFRVKRCHCIKGRPLVTAGRALWMNRCKRDVTGPKGLWHCLVSPSRHYQLLVKRIMAQTHQSR